MSETCSTCAGTGQLHRQDCGAHGLTVGCGDCGGWAEQDAALAIQAAFAEREARLVGALTDVGASLAAAISLLERGGKAAKKVAPSDRMFDQMLKDYSASIERARATLAALKDRTHG